MAASIDNRVPTPASVAETHSQQALPPDYPAAEPKTEYQDDEQDCGSGKKQPDIKMEVWLKAKLCLENCLKNGSEILYLIVFLESFKLLLKSSELMLLRHFYFYSERCYIYQKRHLVNTFVTKDLYFKRVLFFWTSWSFFHSIHSKDSIQRIKQHICFQHW